MKGQQEVIEHLNRNLANELTAMDQYFIHSRMYEDWGLTQLYERIAHEMEDETGHADKIIKRILFLEGMPDLVTRSALRIGRNVPDMLKNDLDLEIKVIDDLKAAMQCCESVQDYQTREILRELLTETEEDHAHWLEQQLGLIEKMGLQNYLQARM